MHSHSFASPSFSLTSTPSKLLVVSSTGRSFIFQTLFLSSSNVPLAPPPIKSLASPNKLPVKLGCVAEPIVPVPKLICQRDEDGLTSDSEAEGVINDPEPTGWCSNIERKGSNGSGGI